MVACWVQVLCSSLFDMQMGIIRTYREANGLGQEPTGEQEVSILQDFLSPHAITPITVVCLPSLK